MSKEALTAVMAFHIFALFFGATLEKAEDIHFSEVTSSIIKVQLSQFEKSQEEQKEKPKPLRKRAKKVAKKRVKKTKPKVSKNEVRSNRKQTASGENTLIASYISQVRMRLEENKKYPRIAKKRRQQGKVTVQFKLNAFGEIISAQITGPSTFRILNKASLETLARAKKFLPFPKGLKKKELTIRVPLLFKLL